jgi:hypothetical protein
MNRHKPHYEWYAIYTKTNGEKQLHRNLGKENIESYLPLTKVLRQWSDRKNGWKNLSLETIFSSGLASLNILKC